MSLKSDEYLRRSNPVYWYTTMPSVYIRTLYVSMFYHKYMYQYICWYLTNTGICRFLINLLEHPISLSVLISEKIERFFFNNVEGIQMYTCTVMLHKVTEVPILYIIYRSYSNEICRMALSLHLLHIILKVSLKINLIN